MAKTKKEIQEQNSEEKQDGITAGLTDSELYPDGSPPAGMIDLELASATTLDPDASQTDENLGEAADGQAPHPQTENDGDASQDESLQPGAEPGEGDSGSQTETESSLEPDDVPQTEYNFQDELPQPGGQPGTEPGEGASDSQTESDSGGDCDERLQPGENDDTPQTDSESVQDAEAGAPPARRRRSTRKKVSETEPKSDASDAEASDEEETNTGQSQKLRMPGRRRQRVVSIDAERTVQTDTDRLRSDLLDLVESLKSKKILTGTIQGVERLADNPEMSYAVIYHGDFKVIIPVLEAIEEPEDYRGQPRGDVLHYLLNKRLGAEVDYIVKGVDQENNVVAASRLEAMALKRREYYFRTDRDGNYQIYEGIRAEARVISVIRAGIFIDLFGAECYIPLRELSYQRWVDAAQHYQPGQRVLVKVLEVDRSDRSHPRVSASVKQAMENPYEKALKKYVVGNRYVGTVSMVDLNGVFVSLDGGVDCLCTYPKRGRPPRGARATVRILGINHENNRIWGVITHMSTTR